MADRDAPWIFRTYAGHTSARASNELFRKNLAAGQTGLSIAFDLPTQCGYDPDHPLARPEVGKVGVPIVSLDDMHVLFEGIPIEQMNTSMTINGTAVWLLALYIALARERGVPEAGLRGTTQNDIVKEYLARGTYIFPPEPSLDLIAETYEYCVAHLPKWNPSNVCSYHLQEAGATPVQELAFALADAIGVLDRVKRARPRRRRGVRRVRRPRVVLRQRRHAVRRGDVQDARVRRAVGRICARTLRRDGSQAAPAALRRTGQLARADRAAAREQRVADPDRGARRDAVASDARCRALQLPTWNEALSLPRPWDQQWSLRLQQILAYETDLLEYGDLFDGQSGRRREGRRAVRGRDRRARARSTRWAAIRGAIETGYCKPELVRAMAARMARIERGEQIVVGVNKWTDALPSPLVGGDDGGVFAADPAAAEHVLAALAQTRARRDAGKVRAALAELEARARAGEPIMEASIACALARVTTGEWAGTLRGVWGEYRAATGVTGARDRRRRRRVDRVARARRGARRGARPAAAVARRQARARWPLERRRDDRGRGARRRLRGDLCRHPARARGDRRSRDPGVGRSRRAVGAYRARTSSSRPR